HDRRPGREYTPCQARRDLARRLPLWYELPGRLKGFGQEERRLPHRLPIHTEARVLDAGSNVVGDLDRDVFRQVDPVVHPRHDALEPARLLEDAKRLEVLGLYARLVVDDPDASSAAGRRAPSHATPPRRRSILPRLC